MKNKEIILSYSEPETKEQIATNLVYLLRENENMKNFQAFSLETVLNSSNTNGIRWKFLEKILPKLNDYFYELLKEDEIKPNDKEIKRLEEILKNIL